MKFTNWNGQSLKGDWLFTLKVDGVQAQRSTTLIAGFPPNQKREHKGPPKTKGGKDLYHLPKILPNFEIAEIYCGSWNETMSIVMASKSKRRQVKRSEIYPLFPNIDKRLIIGTFTDPDSKFIKKVFEIAVKDGHEGLVLRQGNKFIKVKPSYTEDIKITGFVEGKGRLKGMLGKFTTDQGDVGTGFTDDQRYKFWILRSLIVGKMIEVEAMSKSPSGKLRHPRFIRMREDK